MKISIIGCGYVGLVTGACLAELGHEVLGVDNDLEKPRTLKSGRVPIFEPGVDALVATHCKEGRLRFSSEVSEAVDHGQIIFICVGTPPGTTAGWTSPSWRRSHARSPRTCGRASSSTWPPTPSSCARARVSRTSSTPTAS